MLDVVPLTFDQPLPDHPFADAQQTRSDEELLQNLLTNLRFLLHDPATVGIVSESQTIVELTEIGRAGRYVINNLYGLLALSDFIVVGFCGQRRKEITAAQIAEIEQMDRQMLEEIKHHSGILVYCSAQKQDGDWGNLILFEKAEQMQSLGNSAPHTHAAKVLSPDYYESTRIHDGVLPAKIFSDAQLQLRRTRYWDFNTQPTWRGVRTYG